MPKEQLRGASQSQSDVAQAGDALAESVPLLEHLREGGEQQVDDAVHQTHVDGHHDTDRALVQEGDGAHQRLSEEFAQAEVAASDNLNVGVARLLADLGCLALEQDGTEGFAEADEGDDGGDATLLSSASVRGIDIWRATYQHGQQPEDPPPVRGLRQEPACNRPDDGGNQHAQTEDTHDESTLRDGHQIRDGSTAVGQGRATKHTGNESEEQEGGRVGGQAAQRREQGEEDVADVVDEVASVDLGQGREEQGADPEADNLPWSVAPRSRRKAGMYSRRWKRRT